MSFMDCLGQVSSFVLCFWGCSAKHAKYIGDLRKNLKSLSSERDKLMELREDVREKVRIAEEQQMKLSNPNQVNGWLKRVGDMEEEVDEILQEGGRALENKCLGNCCPKNCRSSYKIGKNVPEMISQVTTLKGEGDVFNILADDLVPTPVDELLMDNLESLRSEMVKLEKLRKDVKDKVMEVNEWLGNVESVETKVNQILQKWPFPPDKVVQELPFPSNNVMLGYVYILTHPGNPSISYDHFGDRGIKDQIEALADIRARKSITSRSNVTVLTSEWDLYMAEIDGKIIVKIGTRWELGSLEPPEDDFKVATSGTHYCVYERCKDEPVSQTNP